MADLAFAPTAVLVHEYPLRMAAIERALSETGITVVDKAGRLDNALTALEQTEPDVLVLELDGPRTRGSSIDFIRTVHAHHPDVKIIAFSMEANLDRIDAALGAGATACVVDPRDAGELRAAVRQAVAWALAHERISTAS